MARKKSGKSPWLRGRVPDGYWASKTNRRGYLDWLGRRKRLKKTSDWYRITKKCFADNGGGGLLAGYYRDSPFTAMIEYKPRYDWKPWLFTRAPQGFWQKQVNRRQYMDWLGKQLGFTKTSDWYQVTKADLYDNGGGGMLANHFGDSAIAAVMDYRPEYSWIPWLFRSVPQGFWKVRKNRCAYMTWLGKQLGFRRSRDWYKVERTDFLRHRGAVVLMTYYNNSPLNALREFRPQIRWDRNRF